MIIVFIGPPGSGKGTQAQTLVKNNGAIHVDTGALLRKEIQQKTPLGLKMKSTIDRGDLVENLDQEVFSLVRNNINVTNLIIIDGYPRTLAQASLLDNFLKQNKAYKLKVLYLDLSVDSLYKRFEGRYNCARCGKIYNKNTDLPKNKEICDVCGSKEFSKRSDDTREVFEKRIRNYMEKTRPLIDFYKQRGLLYSIDASKNFDEVYKAILEHLQEKGLKNDTY